MENENFELEEQLFKCLRKKELLELTTEGEKIYKEAVETGNAEAIREAAIRWINVMGGKEFQDRLFSNTIPNFEREIFENSSSHAILPLERQTCHPYRRLSKKELELEVLNQGQIHQDKLRYCSVEQFIEEFYTNIFAHSKRPPIASL